MAPHPDNGCFVGGKFRQIQLDVGRLLFEPVGEPSSEDLLVDDSQSVVDSPWTKVCTEISVLIATGVGITEG